MSRRLRLPRRRGAVGLLVVGALALGGCATRVQVTPMATADVTRAAYQLDGRGTDELRLEAARLCGGSAEVLRESQRGQPVALSSGLIDRWLSGARDWWDGPAPKAQLLVRCPEQPERARAIATYAAPAIPASPAAKADEERSWLTRWMPSWGQGIQLGRLWPFGRKGKPADADVPYGW